MGIILIYCWIGSAGTAPFGHWFVRQSFEKTEMEWFSWWPFQLMMTALALSLILATLRRIPLTLPRLGVWVIHSGVIVLMAGAAVYFGTKQEGDILLFKGGPAAGEFFLHDRFALHVRPPGGSWSELTLSGLPRYREAVADPRELRGVEGDPHFTSRPLDLHPRWKTDPNQLKGKIDFRVTGYVPFAHLVEDWKPGGDVDYPFLEIEGEIAGRPYKKVLFPFDPELQGVDLGPGILEVHASWVTDPADLKQRLDPGPPRLRAVVRGTPDDVDVPLTEAMAREVRFPGAPYRFRVVQYDSRWTTPSAAGPLRAARAVIQIKGPLGVFSRVVVSGAGVAPVDFDRQGKALERLGDERIALELVNIPQAGLHVLAGPQGEHALLVSDGGQVIHRPLVRGHPVDFLEGKLKLALTGDGPRARRITLPQVVPRAERDPKAGPSFSMVRVEARWSEGKTEFWLPYTPYTFPTRMGFDPVTLKGPEGRPLEVLFSRQTQALPVKVALEDFRLETFPGGTRERDFISLVRFQEAGRWTGIHKIHSNNPTAFAGWWFFQSTWDPPDPASGYRGMNFTGLGVGNRHGVWVMLCGGVMTVLGTIWAFYIKPLILKRRSVRRAARKITGSVAAGLSFLILAPAVMAEESWVLSVGPEFTKAINLETIRLAAVQDDGRVKTFDSLARERLKLVNTSGPARSVDPVLRYLDLVLAPQHYAAIPVIHIRKTAFRQHLVQTLRMRVPLEQRFHLITEPELKRIEKGGWVSPAFLDLPPVLSVLESMERDLMRTARDAGDLRTARALTDSGVLNSLLRMVPPAGDRPEDPWSTLEESGGEIGRSWQALRMAWSAQDAPSANQALDQLARKLAAYNPELYPSSQRRSWEHWYYKNHKLTFTWVIYFMALPFLLMAAVYGYRWARGAGFILFSAGLGLHTVSLGLRWVLAGRIPNANMFEAITASAWLGGVAALILEWGLRHRPYRNLPAFAASVYAMIAMMIGRFMPAAIDSDINTVMPVLDRTIWLYIHTNMIIASYALIFFGAVTALLYLGQRGWSWTVGRSISPVEVTSLVLARTLDGATMVFLQLAFVTLWLGTILGAVWADVSWGRPWGWDPKEVFALNTWIVFLILVHVRLKVRDKALWTAVLAVLGCAVMLFNWIAVNFVIAGLHSYA